MRRGYATSRPITRGSIANRPSAKADGEYTQLVVRLVVTLVVGVLVTGTIDQIRARLRC